MRRVQPRDNAGRVHILEVRDSNFVKLSCELEGHALGGGMLKLEPREAARIVMPSANTLSDLPEAKLCDRALLGS